MCTSQLEGKTILKQKSECQFEDKQGGLNLKICVYRSALDVKKKRMLLEHSPFVCESKMCADTCTQQGFEAVWSLKSYLAGLS